MSAFESLSATVDLDQPWRTPRAAELDRVTMREWYNKKLWIKGGRQMMEVALESTIGQDPSCYSMLHAMFFFKSSICMTWALNTRNGAQHEMMQGGGQAIADKIKHNLGDDIVHLSEPVERVVQDDSGVQIGTTKGAYRAKRAIMAVPPPLIFKIRFEPSLPTEKQTLLQHMPMGAYAKFFASYKTAFWRAKGLRGECTNPGGTMAVMFDATPPSGSPAKLMGFVAANTARHFLTLSEEERRRIALGEFALALGKEALEPEETFFHSMIEEEWAMGCPVANPAPGMWTLHGEWMRKPVNRVHWAGTETATHFYGYLEGAVLAGERAAGEVMQVLP